VFRLDCQRRGEFLYRMQGSTLLIRAYISPNAATHKDSAEPFQNAKISEARAISM